MGLSMPAAEQTISSSVAIFRKVIAKRDNQDRKFFASAAGDNLPRFVFWIVIILGFTLTHVLPKMTQMTPFECVATRADPIILDSSLQSLIVNNFCKGDPKMKKEKESSDKKCNEVKGHTHVHSEKCGHRAIPHGDHIDYEHDGHRHRMHGSHVDECKSQSV